MKELKWLRVRKIEIDDERQTLCFQFGKGNVAGALGKRKYENNGL